MFQLKYFSVFILPLAVLSSIAAAQDQSTENLADLAAGPELRLPSPAAGFALDAATSGTPGSGYVRIAPAPQTVKESPSIRPFRSVAAGFTANSLGASV